MSKIESSLDAFAIVMGYLQRQEGKIRRSAFNKIVNELGFDRVSQEQLLSISNEIENSDNSKALYKDSLNGKVKLDDISDNINQLSKVSEKGIFDILTPYTVDRYAVQSQLSSYRKAQRSASAQKYLSELIAKEIGLSLKEKVSDSISNTRNIVSDSDNTNTLVITPADWHIGATVNNVDDNNYNLNIANKRLDEYIVAIDNAISLYKPSSIVLVHLGDFIEGIDMRNINQPFEAEIDATKQLGEALRMYIKLIKTVASWGLPVTVGAIGGNHDRFTSNKKEAIYNDNLAYNVVDTLLLLKQSGGLPDNVIIMDNREDVYSLVLNIENKNFLFVHGDMESRKDDPKIARHIRNQLIDIMYMGHYHYNKTLQEDYARMSYMVGSLMGANNYAKQIGAPRTAASQLLSVVDYNHEGVTSIPVFFEV